MQRVRPRYSYAVVVLRIVVVHEKVVMIYVMISLQIACLCLEIRLLDATELQTFITHFKGSYVSGLIFAVPE
jgi:hypothetical protein